MWPRKKKEVFYYPGVEVSLKVKDKYRCLDRVTLKAVQTARSRMLLLMCGVGLFFGIIGLRLFQLTVLDYRARPTPTLSTETTFALKRQDILDRHGTLLATGLPTIDIYMEKGEARSSEEIARQLVKIFPDLSFKFVMKQLSDASRFRYIKRNITPKERSRLNWLGYYFLKESSGEKRVYPQGNLFSHLIGAVDPDNNGISGLEKSLEPLLSESPVFLSLDLAVQEMTRSVLEKSIRTYQADGALGLVMDVRNGEILASVSLPDFNPNLPREDVTDPKYFNKPISGTYEMGSVFKLFNTAMALEYGDIRPQSTFDASEPLKIGQKTITDFRGQARMLSVAEVLMHSSNIATAQIALRSGYEKQKAFLETFRFNERLSLKLPERAAPSFPREKKWANITSANVGFGYGLSVTPMHVIAGVAALVNGGIYHMPTFIRGGNDGTVEYQVLAEKNSNVLRHMMWAVLNWNAKEDSIEHQYAVGGKTGSANLLKDGRYIEGALRTTFVAAFPMTAPQYAVLVMLENPKKIKETFMMNAAGWNAKPTGLQLISQIAPYLGVAPVGSWSQPAYIEQAIERSKNYKKKR